MSESQRKITAADLLPLAEYEQQRKTLKANLIPVKKLRRIEVGPFATFYFENYATMWLQVMEMLRIEKGGEEQVAGELATYKPLITPFLARAQKLGHPIVDGLEMLVRQAAPSFEAFFGRVPPGEVDVRALCIAALSAANGEAKPS